MSERAREGTAAGLQEFLDWAGRTGEMNPTTAGAWAVSSRRILELEGNPDVIDVRQLDVDELLRRFENRHRMDYTSASLATYKSRFVSAVEAYIAWLDNRPWKPATRAARKPARQRADDLDSKASREKSNQGGQAGASTDAHPAHGSKPLLVTYSVPLRPGLMVELTLPTDMTVGDANRVSAFVRALAFDEPLVNESAT